jgi:predicted RNase H-like HicB family nuclease
MWFDDYKVVLYRQEDGAWVAEIPALGGCYALMDTREAALDELEQVFVLIAEEHRERGEPLPPKGHRPWAAPTSSPSATERDQPSRGTRVQSGAFAPARVTALRRPKE